MSPFEVGRMDLPGKNCSPISSCSGQIQKVVCVNFLDGATTEKTLKEFANLLKGFDSAYFFFFLHFDELIGSKDQYLIISSLIEKLQNEYGIEDCRYEFINFNDYFFLNNLNTGAQPVDRFRGDWAQDICTVLRLDSSKSTIACFPRNPDPFAAYFLSPYLSMLLKIKSKGEKVDLLVRPVRPRFAGGNILTLRNTTFIGKDSIYRNIQRPARLSFAQLCDAFSKEIKAFESALGAEDLMVIGSEGKFRNVSIGNNSSMIGVYQPAFHIDNFLTPGGYNSESRKWRVFLGEVFLIIDPAEKLNEGTRCLISKIEAYLNTLESKLKEKREDRDGFEVIRIPLPLQASNTYDEMYYYGFNNSFIEEFFICGKPKTLDNLKRRVYLPDFLSQENIQFHEEPWLRKSMERYQKRTVRIFKERGFEVVFIKGDWIEKARKHRAGLHCYLKVIQRGEANFPVIPD